MTRSSRSPRERGIAILSVITVLVALLIIAIPFVIAMKLARERTEVGAARNRARFEAELIARAVASYVHKTHPQYEQQRRATSRSGVDADDTVDAAWEFTPPASYREAIAAEASRDGGPTPSYSDPRGSIWSWKVTDCNALVNPNGASPLLIANLMASATLASEIDSSATSIQIENVAPVFAPGGATFRKTGGYVRIGAEVIKYASFDPTMGFQGCERGALRADAPLHDDGPAMIHKKGDVVVDYVAYKLATNLVASKPGSMTPFQNLEQMRLVHLWGGGGVLDSDRFEAILPYMTVWSRRETAETFLQGQRVYNPLPEAAKDGSGEVVKFVTPAGDGGNGAYFNAGTIALVSDGQQYDYVVVDHASGVAASGNEKGSQLGKVLTLASTLPEGRVYEGGRATISPLAPYPIDVNTASREVLAAVMTHLKMRTADDPKSVVTPALAWDLAGRIVESRNGALATEGGDEDKRKGGPFRHYRDVDQFFEQLQKGGVIGPRQREALTRNAINPHDDELAWGTAPFCYRTMDVYSIEARSVVNDAAGTKLAEAAIRQIVEIGADKATVWALDSQADFEEGLALGSGGNYVETYPFNVGYVSDQDAHVQPRRRGPMAVIGRYPSSIRDADLGDVRLQASRIKIPDASSLVLQEHADKSPYADGFYLPEYGPYKKPVKGYLRKDDANDPYIHPFTIALWMRSYSEGNFWVFDTGKENDQNRISLYVRDAEQGGRELVFRVCDSTLQGIGAELYVPLTRIGYQPETWFHLQANARGADPAMMELLVDGVSVGRRRGLSYLTGGLSSTAEAFAVESAEGFEKVGAVQIGNEIVEYDESNGETFAKIHRGMRGTRSKDWPEGTPVKRVGYSHPLLLDARKGGLGLEQKVWAPWGFMKVQAFTNESQATWTYTPPTGPPLTIVFLGLDGKDTSQQQCTLVKDTNPNSTTTDFEKMTEQEQLDTFNSSGYAIMVSPEFDPTPSNLPPAEPALGALERPSASDAVPVSNPAAPPVPGGQGPGAGRPPPPSTPPPPSGGGGGGNPGGSGPGGSRPPPVGRGTVSLSVSKIGGWEVVWYTRNGATLTIDRFQSTAWHQDGGTAYFSPTKLQDPGLEAANLGRVKTYIAPISILGKNAGRGGAPDYLDPGHNPEDRIALEKYPYDGDPDGPGFDAAAWPRVVIGTKDTNENDGAVECVRYDSIDKNKAAGSPIFLRDEDAALLRLEKTLIPFGNRAPNIPGSAGGTTPPPLPPTAAVPREGGLFATVALALRPPASVSPAAGGPRFAAAFGATDDDPPPPDGGDGGTAPVPGGVGPGAGREPPPDNSGGGGTEPQPGTGPGNNQPPPGVRPPTDAPPADPGGSSGGGTPGGSGDGSTLILVTDGPYDPPRISTLATQFPFRGVNDTLSKTGGPGLRHTSLGADDEDARILPCFRVMRRDPDTAERVGGFPPGSLDVVTLTTGVTSPRREQKRVRWAHSVSNSNSSDWLALSDFLETQPFVPEADVEVLTDYRGKTRLMKFPSGELPDEHGQDLVFGKNEVGGGSVVTAFLDEIAIWRHQAIQPIGFVVNRQNIEVRDTEISVRAFAPATTLQGIDGYDKDCGVLDLEGELIVYRGTRSDSPDTITFERCARGTLGTRARPHAPGVDARLVPDVWVSYLQGSLTRDSASIPVGRTKGWPREGLVRILSEDTAELVHFTSRSDEALNLPESLDADEASRGRGLLRGRFGTELQTHENDELVLWQPFRYWDRYMPRRSRDRTTFAGIHDHPDGCYVEFAKTVYQAQWRKLGWVENLDGRRVVDTQQRRDRNRSGQERSAGKKMDVLVLVRFDQGVPWDEPNKIIDMRGNRGQVPNDAKDHPERYLYLFDDPEAANRMDVEADTAEFRVYFPYLLTAYVPQDLVANALNRDELVFENTWKQTPWLREFHVEYINRTKERYSADIR